MFDASADLPFDSRPSQDGPEDMPLSPANLVFDSNMRQLFVGDFVVLPCFNSVVDRGVVVAVNGTIVEYMILAADTGIPETIVLDMRRPDAQTGYFGRYGYVGVTVCARKGEAAAQDFSRQLLAACEQLHSSGPRMNPYLAAQARMRLEFLKNILQ